MKGKIIYTVAAILGIMTLFGCDSKDGLVNNKSGLNVSRITNSGSVSSLTTDQSKITTAVFPASDYANSYQTNGASSTISTTANPAISTATDGQDIHIHPSGNPQSEVHISVSLVNPDNLLVSANTTIIGNSYRVHDIAADIALPHQDATETA